MRFQNLENTAFALSAGRVTPGKAHDRTDTCLGQDSRRDLHGVFLEPSPQLLSNDRAYVLRPDIANSIFQPRQRIPQSRTEVLIACDDLSQFLQAGYFCDQPQQALFRGSRQGKLKLLEQLGGEARGRKVRHHEHHGVPNRWTPRQVRLWN